MHRKIYKYMNLKKENLCIDNITHIYTVFAMHIGCDWMVGLAQPGLDVCMDSPSQATASLLEL